MGTITPRSIWVAPLPKIELHLHLEGAIRSETVRELSMERQGWEGPLPSGWEEWYYTFSDFAGFLDQLTPRFPFRPDEYARIATECFEDLVVQNVVYAEVSFDAPVTIVGEEARFWPIMEALEGARLQAEARWPIRINYIVGLQRRFPVEVAVRRVELAAEARDRGMGVVGIDLHGDEINFPADLFKPAYDVGRARGLGLRCHAGEAAGTESIWQAMNVLGAWRIAHGVRAVEDPALLARLQRRDVTLEVCPTSNVRCRIVHDIHAHPVRFLYDLGIPITVNSDDPLPFFTDMNREVRLLVDEFDFTCPELREIMLNAAHAAFLSEDERQALCALIDGAYTSAERTLAETAS